MLDQEKRNDDNNKSVVIEKPNPVNVRKDIDCSYTQIAELIRSSKHLVVFTGAGISTSTGLPDYRGENGIRLRKKRRKVISNISTMTIDKLATLVPSPTHMALAVLYKHGYIKHIVTQNIDDLHLKSGLNTQSLTELHGNATCARCDTCSKIYRTNFPAFPYCNDPDCESTKRPYVDRVRCRTRKGNGELKRFVIKFNEELDLGAAIDHCEAADVAMVLGTSLKVEPFASLASKHSKHLIIINLQSTESHYDNQAAKTGIRLYEHCDEALKKIMKKIFGEDYVIPNWEGNHKDYIFMSEETELSCLLSGRN